jgi:hypothetical protein
MVFELYGEIGGGGLDIDGCASGVVLIEYRVWYDGTWGPWTTYWEITEDVEYPFSLTGGCEHYLQFRAYDCLGNTLYAETDIPPPYRDVEIIVHGDYIDLGPGSGTPETQSPEAPIGIQVINRDHPLIYDNDMTATNLGASQWDPSFNFDPIVADDFTLDTGSNVVHQVHWIGGYWNPVTPGYFDWEIVFYEDRGDGQAPGATYAGPFTYTYTEAHETPSGSYYSYWVNLTSDVTFSPTTKYWMSIQGIGTYPPQSGWGVHTAPINGAVCKLKSIYFGYPDWTDLGFGDCAFQLYGPFQEPPPPPPDINVYNQTHYVDLEPPISWIMLELDHYDHIITPYTEFTIWAEDFACEQPGGSQCYIIHYNIDGPTGGKFYLGGNYYDADGTWRTGPPSTPVAFQIRDETGYIKAGAYTIRFWAEDCFGNQETVVHMETYFPDTGAPTTSLLFNGPYYDDGDEWINSDTQIVLNAQDQGSGATTTKYQIDNGVLRTYTGPFTIPTEGKHTILYYSRDNVNQKENEHIQTVIVDNAAPDATIGFEGDIYDDEITKWLTQETQIQIPASDTGCGLKAIYYRINGGVWNEYTEAFTLDAGNLIEFYAEDHLGNAKDTTALNIGIDTEAPTIQLNAPRESHLYIAGREILSIPNAESIIFGSLVIDVGATDNCGVAKTEVYIDGELRYMEPDNTLQWLWDEKALFTHTITVRAYDNLGRISTKSVDIKIFNL